MELEVIWSGAHKDTYLCIPEWHEPKLRPLVCHVPKSNYERAAEKGYADWSDVRDRMLLVLAEKPRWRVRDLRRVLQITPPVMAGLLDRAVNRRLVRRVGVGVVVLVGRGAA